MMRKYKWRDGRILEGTVKRIITQWILSKTEEEELFTWPGVRGLVKKRQETQSLYVLLVR
jgi:hypothetical protein